MIRYISLLLFIGLVWGQNNPCNDIRYKNIKEKSLDEMSEREYSYFLEYDSKCNDYQKSITENKVFEKDGIIYELNTGKLFNGYNVIYKNDNRYEEGYYINGQKHGIWITWVDGVKRVEQTYKNGRKDGLELQYVGDGITVIYESNWSDGWNEGLATSYISHDNTLKKNIDEIYKNGRITSEIHYEYHDNGKLESKTFYNGDAQLISSKCWDEDGNECECSEEWWNGCK